MFRQPSTTELKVALVRLVSILIEVSCFIFVIVQTYQCVSKYAQYPQGTSIKRVEAKKEAFPDVTICPLDETEYSMILNQCNLTYEMYFKNGIWKSDERSGLESFCNDPEALFNKMATVVFEGFELWYITHNDDEYIRADAEELSCKDYVEFGRCLTFTYPNGIDGIWELNMSSNKTRFQVMIYTPGNFFTMENINAYLEPNYEVKLDVAREVNEVLDHDGKPCSNIARDICITAAMNKRMIETVGCTTPFLPEKSKICTNSSEAVKALAIGDDIFTDMRLLEKMCPRSCVEVYVFEGEKQEEEKHHQAGTLSLQFSQFVKVYKSYWAYEGLEMIAEVGGYVGLFLGVSVNQIKLLFERFFRI